MGRGEAPWGMGPGVEMAALWRRWRGCAAHWWPLWLLFALSAFDGLLTHAFLRAGWAEELNPLMRRLWTESPLLFGAFKLTTAGLAVIALRLGRDSAFCAALLLTALAAYALVTCVHLFWLSRAALFFAGAIPTLGAVFSSVRRELRAWPASSRATP